MFSSSVVAHNKPSIQGELSFYCAVDFHPHEVEVEVSCVKEDSFSSKTTTIKKRNSEEK